MSVHLIQRRLETAAATYLAAEIVDLPTVRLTEDDPVTFTTQGIYALCPRAEAHQLLPGCYLCTLTVEIRTALNLHADRAAAVVAHFALWGSLADAMMQDDLATSLAGAVADLGINGIEDGHQLRQENANGVLVNSITRMIHAVPKTLTA